VEALQREGTDGDFPVSYRWIRQLGRIGIIESYNWGFVARVYSNMSNVVDEH